mgnify:FL=1
MEIFELIENGDYHAIREEIESFDLEIVNEEGDTPLHYAVKNEDFELLEILLAYVPDIDVENEEGDTALHLAIKTSDIELVQLLIDSGANVDVKDSKKRTPSVHANQLKEDVIYRLLKEASNENLGGKVKMKKNINIDN